MRLPRDVSGSQLVKCLERVGYRVTRQTGSHSRLTCDAPSPHHLTVPNHNPIRVGTLAAILSDVAAHLKISKEQLVKQLFG